MTDVKITLTSLQKEVLVSIPNDGDATEAFNEAAAFVRTLEAGHKIRDPEQGINPPGATHEVVKENSGEYRLKRFRFSGAF